MNMRKTYLIKGQSLFEIVVAIGIVSVILVALVSLTARSLRSSTYSKNTVITTQLASEAMEWMRGQRDSNWTSFAARASSSGTTWCLSSLTWVSGTCTNTIPNTIYTRSVRLTSLDQVGSDGIADTVDAEIIVSWSDNDGVHETRSNTRYTNWRR